MSKVLFEKTDRIGRITLNRPEVMNAIDDEVPHLLAQAVEEANADPDIHVIVLSGSGKAFCSGYDLAYYAEGNGSGEVTQEMPWDPMKDYTLMSRKDGAVSGAEEGAAIFKRACVSAEFHAFAGKGSSPVTLWLRALARFSHEECGGPGVGAIGMCFTGNFALTMMLEPSMLAPVLSQPSLPMDDPAGLESSPEEIEAVRQRLEKDDLTVLAYRFEGDKFCMAQRFAAYADGLGDRFVERVLPDEAANTDDLSPFAEQFVTTPHSVVTTHLIDEAGQPTIIARDEILSFFSERLG